MSHPRSIREKSVRSARPNAGLGGERPEPRRKSESCRRKGQASILSGECEFVRRLLCQLPRSSLRNTYRGADGKVSDSSAARRYEAADAHILIK